MQLYQLTAYVRSIDRGTIAQAVDEAVIVASNNTVCSAISSQHLVMARHISDSTAVSCQRTDHNRHQDQLQLIDKSVCSADYLRLFDGM